MTSIGLGLWTKAIVRRYTIKPSLDTVHQSESKGRMSMKFNRKYYNDMNNEYGTPKISRK